jgi:LCP family protein required for cell wall assembly
MWGTLSVVAIYSTTRTIASIENLSGGCDVTSEAVCGQEIEMTKPFVVYISGMDAYGEVKEESRSDVNQLLVFDPTNKRILNVNTPRDYQVQLHGLGPLKDKLTHAGVYGIDVSRRTMEDLYGISIDYYVKVNFTSFISLIDILGYITVNSSEAFHTEHMGGWDFVEGPNTVNGKAALAFSRERKVFASGDRQRGINQQLVVSAIMKKLSKSSASQIWKVLDALRGQFITNVHDDDVNKLIKAYLSENWNIETISANGNGAMERTFTYPGQDLYVMAPDSTSVLNVKNKIQTYINFESSDDETTVIEEK